MSVKKKGIFAEGPKQTRRTYDHLLEKIRSAVERENYIPLEISHDGFLIEMPVAPGWVCIDIAHGGVLGRMAVSMNKRSDSYKTSITAQVFPSTSYNNLQDFSEHVFKETIGQGSDSGLYSNLTEPQITEGLIASFFKCRTMTVGAHLTSLNQDTLTRACAFVAFGNFVTISMVCPKDREIAASHAFEDMTDQMTVRG